MEVEAKSGEAWSLRAKLVIRPEGEGITVVTAEGGAGPLTSGTSGTTTSVSSRDGAGCSVTLSAGPHHTLTLTCNPSPKPSPPSSREVASQTSNSLIPHLLQQFNNNPQGPKVFGEIKSRKPVSQKVVSGDGKVKKNPRTVHIDVYCTESSGDSGGEGSLTVYESDKSKVVHERKSSSEVPHGLQRQHRRVLSTSDNSAMGGRTTGFSSGSSGWSTSSDITSTTSSQSCASIAQTDSFDYENSRDRLRILEKEKQWRQWNDVSEETTTSDSDDDSSGPELAWSFAEADGGGLKRTDTIKRTQPPASLSEPDMAEKQYLLDRIGPHTFGPVIRRPNRHVGPVKNPNCSCNTCKFYCANNVTQS